MDETPPTDELLGLLRQMEPHEFEKLVAELWRQLGYSATVRQRSRDRGIDVIATRESPVKEKHVIQAKRYGGNNKVGSQEVREYATLYQQVADADKVIIVTTGKLTTEARRLAKDLNVEYISDEELCNKIRTSAVDVEEYLPIKENQPSQTTSTQSKSNQTTRKEEGTSSESPSTKSSSPSVSSSSQSEPSISSPTRSRDEREREDRNRDVKRRYEGEQEDEGRYDKRRYESLSEPDVIDARDPDKFVRLRDEGREKRGDTPLGEYCPICNNEKNKLYQYSSDDSEFEITYEAILREKTASTPAVVGCKTCGSLWVKSSGFLSSNWNNVVKNDPSESAGRNSTGDEKDRDGYRGIH